MIYKSGKTNHTLSPLDDNNSWDVSIEVRFPLLNFYWRESTIVGFVLGSKDDNYKAIIRHFVLFVGIIEAFHLYFHKNEISKLFHITISLEEKINLMVISSEYNGK